jgi:hypothetical protein
MNREEFVRWLEETVQSKVIVRVVYEFGGWHQAVAFTKVATNKVMFAAYDFYKLEGVDQCSASYISFYDHPGVGTAVEIMLAHQGFDDWWMVQEQAAACRANSTATYVKANGYSLESFIILAKMLGYVEAKKTSTEPTESDRQILIQRLRAFFKDSCTMTNQALDGLNRLRS